MLKQNVRKLDLKFKDEIISEYNSGKNLGELSRKYNVGSGSIYYLLKKNGVKFRTKNKGYRKYKIVDEFFDEINSQEKAYFLGFLYADGCHSPSRYHIQMSLSEIDFEILDKLSKLIFENKPLKYKHGKYIKSPKTGKTYWGNPSYLLTINNKHMSHSLLSHGLIQAKSLILKFPKLEDNLIRHFVRGYFDGDGAISITNNQISISILGTADFNGSLKEILKNLNIKCSICAAKKDSKVTQLVIHGNTCGRKFLKWIYNESIIHMARKYNKYQEILTIIPKEKMEFCSVCNEQHYSKGYCKKHHYEFIGKAIRHMRWLTKGC